MNHYPQGQIGEQCTPMSVDVAHFDPWKRRCWIQELVWHKWFRVGVCLPGQRVEETAAGTPGYTDSRSRDRNLTRFMYITEKRLQGRDVHRRKERTDEHKLQRSIRDRVPWWDHWQSPAPCTANHSWARSKNWERRFEHFKFVSPYWRET